MKNICHNFYRKIIFNASALLIDTGHTHYIFYYILLCCFSVMLLVINILPFVCVDYFSYLYKIY